MKFNLIIVSLLLIFSSTISTANPGGEVDSVSSRDCAGSCHSSPSTNGQSSAAMMLEAPEQVYAGLLFDLTSTVGNVEVSSNNMVGFNLLVNDDGAKDLPSNDGWEIITDPTGGTNNFAQIVDSFSSVSVVERTWTLRAPSEPGSYTLYLAVQHGTPQGGVAMTGISEPYVVNVSEVPENLPRLSPNWEPPNSRNIGEETSIKIETLFTEKITVEMKNGGQITTLEVVNGEFIIPASINEGVVEWRVIMEGEGPVQTSPWFRLSSTAPGWEVDQLTLYLQGFGLLLLFLGLVLSFRGSTSELGKEYSEDQLFGDASQMTPQDATTQIPEGWTQEQWEYYGQEHLDSLAGGGQQ